MGFIYQVKGCFAAVLQSKGNAIKLQPVLGLQSLKLQSERHGKGKRFTGGIARRNISLQQNGEAGAFLEQNDAREKKGRQFEFAGLAIRR